MFMNKMLPGSGNCMVDAQEQYEEQMRQKILDCGCKDYRECDDDSGETK